MLLCHSDFQKCLWCTLFVASLGPRFLGRRAAWFQSGCGRPFQTKLLAAVRLNVALAVASHFFNVAIAVGQKDKPVMTLGLPSRPCQIFGTPHANSKAGAGLLALSYCISAQKIVMVPSPPEVYEAGGKWTHFEEAVSACGELWLLGFTPASVWQVLAAKLFKKSQLDHYFLYGAYSSLM